VTGGGGEPLGREVVGGAQVAAADLEPGCQACRNTVAQAIVFAVLETTDRSNRCRDRTIRNLF
jgi:hypothetical protein